MKKKQEKQQEAEKLRSDLATVSSLILSTFSGLTVEQETRLRRAVEAAGGRYRVVKNRVAERASSGTPAEGLLKGLGGTNSIAYTATDPAALAKALVRAVKDVPAFQFKAGLVEGRVLSVDEIQQLAQLPSREELLARIAFLLGTPARRLAAGLAALERNLAVVLNEAVQANKFAQSAGGNDSNVQ
jgi:large subunit ribosomal protein L10